jgi:hypothetical protein
MKSEAIIIHAVIFGLPWLMYAVWRLCFSSSLRFRFAVTLIIVTIWLLLWPASYSPQYYKNCDYESSDGIVTAFLFTGWIFAGVGSFPVFVFEGMRKLWSRFRCCRQIRDYDPSQITQKAEQDASSDGDKHPV